MKTAKKNEPQTDLPLSEKDEVKNAEQKMAEFQKKSAATKKAAGKSDSKSNK